MKLNVMMLIINMGILNGSSHEFERPTKYNASNQIRMLEFFGHLKKKLKNYENLR